MKQLAILSSAKSHKNLLIIKRFTRALQEKLGDGVDVRLAHFDDFSLLFDGQDSRIMHLEDDWDLNNSAFVYFKSHQKYSEQATAIAEVLRRQGVKVVCEELFGYISYSKLTQYARLSQNGFAIPKTLFVPEKHLSTNYESFRKELNGDFIFKAIEGRGGDLNFLVKSKREYNAILKQHPDTQFIGQEFIQNDSDLRLLVIGGEVRLIIRRQRKNNDTHLNNTSQGASATELDLMDVQAEILALAEASARLFKRDISGVDIIMESGTEKAYILEVNPSPQIASGSETDRKIEEFCNYFQSIL